MSYFGGPGTVKSSSASGVDLDRERQDLVQQNQRRLQELGLLPFVTQVNSALEREATGKKAEGRKRQAEPSNGEQSVLRRSLRARGQQPDLPPVLDSMFRGCAEERPYDKPAPERRRAPSATEACGDAAKFDAHNLHRLRSMSDDAMLKRIHKITNTLKLKSLVGLLREFGRDELADEAQAVLDELLAAVR